MKKMDIPIGLLIIAILILVIVLVWLWQIKGREAAADQFERQTQAEAELYASNRRADLSVLQQLRPVVHGDIVVLPVSVIDGRIDYSIHRVTGQAESIIAQTSQMQAVEVDADKSDLQIAYQIILASIDKPQKDNQILPGNKFTSQKVWQRGINELKRRCWVRIDGNKTYPAIGHDLNWVKNMIEADSAVTALPRASESDTRIKLSGNGNGNGNEERE